MEGKKVFSRRCFLRLASAGGAMAVLTACATPTPQVIKETVVVKETVPVKETVVVKETVPVKETVVVKETVEKMVTKEVEKIVEATPVKKAKPDWVIAEWFDPPQPSDYPYDDMNKKYKISLLFFSYYGDAMRGPEKDYVHAWLNKYFNVDLQPVGDRNAFQKLQLMVAAGDIPDLVTGLNRAQMVEMINQGIFVEDLKPIAEKYMPNYFKKLLGGKWDKVSAAFNKGGLIALAPPAAPNGFETMYVRKPWLDKLGLPEPKTMDDVFNAMVAFREKDPDGNGKQDTYGILFWVPEWARDTNPYGDFATLSGLFGAPAGYFLTDDGKLSCGFWVPGRKAWIEYMKKLNDAGVLPEDWLSQDAAKFWAERVKRNDYGFFPVHPWNMYTGKYQVDPEDAPNFIHLADLQGPAGKKMGWQNEPMLTWNFSQNLAKDEGKLKRVAHMMDVFALNSSEPSRVCSNLWGWGIKDFPLSDLVQVKLLDEWTYSMDIEPINEWHNTKGKELGLGISMHEWMALSWGRWYPQMYLENKAEVYTIGGFRSDLTFGIWAKEVAERPAYIRANITPEANVSADLNKHRVENELKFILGKRPLSEWDAYVKEQLDKIGGRKVLQEGLKQLQENKQNVTGIDPAIPS